MRVAATGGLSDWRFSDAFDVVASKNGNTWLEVDWFTSRWQCVLHQPIYLQLKLMMATTEKYILLHSDGSIITICLLLSSIMLLFLSFISANEPSGGWIKCLKVLNIISGKTKSASFIHLETF